MIEISHEHDGDLTIFTVKGHTTTEEIVAFIEENFKDIKKLALWDLIEGTLDDLDTGNFKKIASAVKEHAKHEKTAYVTENKIEFNFLNLYTVYTKLVNFSVKIKPFKKKDDAMKWLFDS